MFVQPVRETRVQLAFHFGIAFVFGVMAAALAVSAPPVSLGAVLLLVLLISIALVFVLLGLLIRPVRLYRDGIEIPYRFRTAFWRYDDIRDAHLVKDEKERPSALIVTRRDGLFFWAGTLWSSEVSFGSARLEKITNFIRSGIAERGAVPAVKWSPPTWRSVQPLLFRGAIIAGLEAMAASHGVMVIDEAFVRRAQEEDKTLRKWFSASQAALAHQA